MNTTEMITRAQDQTIDFMSAVQGPVVDSVRKASTFAQKNVDTDRLGDLPFADKLADLDLSSKVADFDLSGTLASLEELPAPLDGQVAFAKRVLENQQAFAVALIEAVKGEEVKAAAKKPAAKKTAAKKPAAKKAATK